MTGKILIGDVLEKLATLPADHFDCVVTSPPYWGLRDYGEPGQIGLEPTMQEHIDKMVIVCAEIHRVLKPGGTFWLNYGDCYANNPGSATNRNGLTGSLNQGRSDFAVRDANIGHKQPMNHGLKPKDLCMIPNRLAIALQEGARLGPIKSNIDAAWLAGLIDADGCIGIRRQDNGKWNPTFIPYLSISMTDRIALERCVALTGLGNINLKRAANHESDKIPNRRDFWVWRLDGQVASKVIRDVYPFLVVKQRQAQVCYAMNISQGKARASRSKPLSDDIVSWRSDLYKISKALNQRQDVTLPKLPPVEPNMSPRWWVRSEIIWAKPNPMPESVTDRPATAHEKVWLLTKQARYFYDNEAVRIPVSISEKDRIRAKVTGRGNTLASQAPIGGAQRNSSGGYPSDINGRNLRNYEPAPVQVWNMATRPFPGAHFATFLPELVERCLMAGTSQRGICAACGAPWVRDVETTPATVMAPGSKYGTGANRNDGGRSKLVGAHAKTLGWSPSCACDAATVPSRVLDPFGGAGTVGLVADAMNLDWTLIELNPEYAAMAEARIKARVAKNDAPKAPRCAGTDDLFETIKE